ncbi:MAG: hypothetical protein IID38_12865, partial [Planctomycetes bacterium]|nr:hypothetical protein [Planctomycetota bacterium]
MQKEDPVPEWADAIIKRSEWGGHHVEAELESQLRSIGGLPDSKELRDGIRTKILEVSKKIPVAEDTGGGGGGGGVSTSNFIATPKELRYKLIQGSFDTKTLKLENKGDTQLPIHLEVSGDIS